MKSITVSAPGKIHLLGEHVVVYGKPSILAAVNKRCSVSLIPVQDKTITITSKNIAASETFTEKSLISQTREAQKKWEEFIKSNNSALLKSITSKPLSYATIIVGETLLYYQQPLPSGFSLTIDSAVVSGMGSSSSLAVAIAGAVSLFLGKKFDREVINDIAFRCEQKQHGYPSGGDNSVCTYGGLVWYRKETPDLKIIQQISFALSETLIQNFFLINTGRPKESTGEMVSLVAALTQKRPAYTKEIYTDQEALVRRLLSALKIGDAKEVTEIIQAGERNLEKLEVVSSYGKGIIRAIEKSGGVAKICGAGGKTKEAGIVLCYHPDKKVLEAIMNAMQLSVEEVSLGGEGVREEKATVL